mgnify:CR=1 FL=1
MWCLYRATGPEHHVRGAAMSRLCSVDATTVHGLAKDEALLVWRILAAVDDVEKRTGVRPNRVFVPVDLWPESIAFGSVDVGGVLAERSRFAPKGQFMCLLVPR